MTDRRPLRPFIVDPFDYTAPSFSALLRQAVPEAMPQMGDVHNLPAHVEGTTIVATTYAGGVIIAGDRRATAGRLDRGAAAARGDGWARFLGNGGSTVGSRIRDQSNVCEFSRSPRRTSCCTCSLSHVVRSKAPRSALACDVSH